ncbi:carboxypeptidase-like regulatory domain-containing protein [Hymenobacter koreensis]|uniref:Carboxypeptidase-like regulatory domain-containing protein n=1 Tax=Hymenobacter koreensis TaxID=1084523 RepID=A0ABP8J8C8_9BACT
MRIVFALFLFLLLCSSVLRAQQLTGNVVTADSGQPVAFATVGVKGKAVGTTTNEAGRFAFTAPESVVAQDSVIISCIGYRPLRLTIDQVKQSNRTWQLQPARQALQEVRVRHGRVAPAVLGRDAIGGAAHWTTALRDVEALKTDERGWEIVTLLPVRKSCYLDAFSVYIEQNGFQPVRMRFMLYSVENGKPGRQLLTDDIQFVIPSQQTGWATVDLSSYNIHLPKGQTVAAGIQWLHGEKLPNATQALGGPGAIPSVGSRVAIRNKSEDNWRVLPVNVSMYLAVQQYK